MFDWILRGARVPGNDGYVVADVGLAHGRVAAVAPRLEGGGRELDAGGRLVVPGFSNACLSLPPGPSDLEDRALLALETAARHGTTAITVTVDTDAAEPVMPLRLLARLRAQVAERLSVTLALRLASDALAHPAGLGAFLESARRAGADVIEIVVDRDLARSRGFDDLLGRLAELDLALDVAVDRALPVGRVALVALALPAVLAALEAAPRRPPTRVLYACALAAVHRDEAVSLLARLRTLDLPLVVCPLETLRSAARDDSVAVRRGLPRLHEALDAGVALRFGSGAAVDATALDPLSLAWLVGHASHVETPRAIERLRASVAPGLVAPGAPADLVVVDAPTLAAAVADRAEKIAVFKAGRLVHETARVTASVSTGGDRLLIRDATLLRRPGRWDVVIERGVIREVAPRITGAGDGDAIVADGRLVVPAFVDAHLHLDRAFIVESLRLGDGPLTATDAAAALRAAKAAYTREDVLRRGRLALKQALRHGTTAVRAQCDVDPLVGLLALEALVELKHEFADRVDLQIVAFPQQGLVGDARALELMRHALKAGADIVGGGPVDADYKAHIGRAFLLAQEFGAPVDIHADLPIDNLRPITAWEAPLVASYTRALGLRHRVAVGHFASSSALTAEETRVLADVLADAGVHVTAMPSSELCRQGLGDVVNARRGVPRIHELLEGGVNVALASNNLRDVFVPFGNADMLEHALLGATACHLDDFETALEMVTSRAAAVMELARRDAVAPGREADLVVLDARSATEAVGDQAEKLYVIRRGHVVLTNRHESHAQ